MSKFSGAASVKAAQAGQLGELNLPTPQPAVEEEAPVSSSLLGKIRDELEARPKPPPEEQQAQAVADATAETAAEQERFRVPSMNERAQSKEPGGRYQPFTPQTTPDAVKFTKALPAPEESPNGGLLDRANSLAENSFNDKLGMKFYLSDPTAQVEQAAAIRESAAERAAAKGTKPTASLNAALASVNALEQNPNGQLVPTKRLMAVGSVVTENVISDLAYGLPDIEVEAEIAMLEGRDPEEAAAQAAQRRSAIKQGKGGKKRPEKFAREASNARLGQEIYQHYQRLMADDIPTKLPSREAEVLGDMFKEAWYQNNKEEGLMEKIQVGDHNFYQLTPKGADILNKGAAARKKWLPKQEVLPAKNPIKDNKLPGDVGANVVKGVSGSLGHSFKGSRIEEAQRNLATIGHVVDTRRGMLSLATVLPALVQQNPDSWQAEIHGFGKKKMRKAMAKHAGNREAALAELQEQKVTLANEVKAAASDRKGINYLSYYTQAYNGRIAPQQTYFNPTSSKYIRALTRSANPSVLGVPNKDGKANTMKEWALQNMYAMMLVKDADALLPDGRLQKLEAAEPQLLSWAAEIEEAMANSMTDAQYEAVSEAISQGMPLDDPNFPQFQPLQLSPELSEKVASKGEDGIAFMDGLLDFKDYVQARKDGRPFHTYFNATFDGKTNGIASNGLQMGDERVAYKTGVLRDQNVTLLDNDMDIRDDLQEEVFKVINRNGFTNAGDLGPALTDVANEIFKVRDLHKAVTMTFGYGMDIKGFVFPIQNTMEEIRAKMNENPDSDEAKRYLTSIAILDDATTAEFNPAQALLAPYAEALINVMSEDALAARSVMRSSAAMFAAMNMPFKIKSPSDTNIIIGGKMSEGAEGADASRYDIGGQRPKVVHYENRVTAAAPRNDVAGGVAFSGSIPGPVQALDADTVARAFSGKSWKKMEGASGGKPYMHPIYDAFKVDLNGFATSLEEVNNGWLDASAEWSYLESTRDGLDEAYAAFQEEYKDRSPRDPLSNQEAYYMRSMLTQTESQSSGKLWPANLTRMFEKTLEKGKNEDADDFFKRSRDHAYDLINTIRTPLDKLTVADLREFNKQLRNKLDINHRLSTTIGSTNDKKKKLIRKARHEGLKLPNGRTIPGQYWAH